MGKRVVTNISMPKIHTQRPLRIRLTINHGGGRPETWVVSRLRWQRLEDGPAYDAQIDHWPDRGKYVGLREKVVYSCKRIVGDVAGVALVNGGSWR